MVGWLWCAIFEIAIGVVFIALGWYPQLIIVGACFLLCLVMVAVSDS